MRDSFFRLSPGGQSSREFGAQRRSNNTFVIRTYVTPSPHDIGEVATLYQMNLEGGQNPRRRAPGDCRLSGSVGAEKAPLRLEMIESGRGNGTGGEERESSSY